MNKIAVMDEDLSRSVAPLGELDDYVEAEHDDLAVTLRLIWSALYRNWRLIAGIVAATMILGIVLTMLMTPKFQASSSVQIEQQDTKVLASQDTTPIATAQDEDRFLQTQQDVLKSRALAERVTDSLGLARDDQFLLKMHIKPLDQPEGTLDLPSSKRKQVLDIVDKSLSVDIPRNSRIAQISFLSPDPALAAQMANSYAQNFILWNMKRKFDTTAYARTFLGGQLGIAKQKLEDSERAMIAYARSAGLIDASSGMPSTASGDVGPKSLTTANLVQINGAYTAAQAASLAAQQHWNQASKTPLMNLPEVLSNPAILELTQRRAELQAAYQQELQRRQAEFPQMRQAAAQIAELDKQIKTLAQSVRDTIRSGYETSAKQARALAADLNALKTSTLSEQDRSVQYNILRRETDTNRAMYDALLQRYKEVSAAAGISANNISIVDVADVPVKPVSPRPFLNLFAAGLLGLLLSGVIVLLREKFDDVVRSPDEVQQKLGFRVLNSIPMLRGGESPQEMLGDPRSSLSESYAALRASLDLSTATGAPRSLLITSSRQAEGKSTSAYAIARDFATIGRRVILIDGDLRKPSLHRVLGLSNTIGFTNLLTRHRELDDVIQSTSTPNLSFIASGPLPPNPAELLSGPLLRNFLEDLESRFDMLIVDGPPVLGLADTILLSANLQATLFVIEANGSHRGHAKAAIRRLIAANAKVIGVILTKFDARKIGYGYGYKSGYGYYYSYGNENAGTKRIGRVPPA